MNTVHQSAADYYQLGLLMAQDPTRLREAEIAYRNAITLEPNNARYVYRLALFLHENVQRLDEAEITYRQAIARAPEDPYCYGGLITLLVQQARKPEAMWFGSIMRTLLTASGNSYGLATLEGILGNVDAALEYLQQAATQTNFNREWARNDPDLALIRDDPRFEEIVGAV